MPVVHNIPGEHNRGRWYCDLPNRSVQDASIGRHPKHSSQKMDPKMIPHSPASTKDNSMADSFPCHLQRPCEAHWGQADKFETLLYIGNLSTVPYKTTRGKTSQMCDVRDFILLVLVGLTGHRYWLRQVGSTQQP